MSLFKRKKVDNIPRRRLDDVDSSNGIGSNFKRNQTLSNMNSSLSPRLKTHHLSIKRRKVLTVFAIILLSSLTILLLICNLTAKVLVEVSGVSTIKTIEKPTYEKVIQEYLDINPAGRVRFLLDQSALQNFVINKLPEVASVSQTGIDGFGVSVFNVKMRTPVAGWIISNKQYFVDASGISFNINYFDSPSVQIIDKSGLSLQSGGVIVSQRFLSFIGLVVTQIKNSGYTVTQAILPANTTRELQLRIKEGDYLVKLSIDRPVGEQVEDMSVSLNYFTNHGQKPEYIDVRVSGKAFYK